MRKTLTYVTAAFALTGMAYADKPIETPSEELAKEKAEMDIVDIAAGAEDFTTLVAAVKAAGLEETLRSEGPFTVFAPTNLAFEALPDGTVAELLKPENKEKLASILSYHVVPGKVMAADVSPMKVATVEGSEATVTLDGETVMLDDAKIVRTDIEASNGVIHVIDKVIMPSAE